ncbi:MAG TPA: DoxX family protein [Polyangiaceae bacterium]|nr:DoxX family protein [Polyangiaceae bacterium]
MTHALSKLPEAARILLGLIFVVFGLNGFFGFLPQPPLPEAAVPFITGLAQSGYFFPFLKGVEVTAGALLLARAFVPLALTVLAPIIVNIALFHLLLAPNLLMVALLVVLELYLAWSYRDAFAPMLRRRTPLSVPRLAPNGGDYGSQPERA